MHPKEGLSGRGWREVARLIAPNSLKGTYLMSMPSATNVVEKLKGRRTQAGIPERRECAFRAYLDILETAAWFRYQVEPQLGDSDLNLERFRFLEILYREGPMSTVEMGK